MQIVSFENSVGLVHCKCTSHTSNAVDFKSRYHSHKDRLEKFKDSLPLLLKFLLFEFPDSQDRFNFLSKKL